MFLEGYSISPSAGSHFKVFWGSFWGMLLYLWELFPILSYEILYICFCITLTVNVLRKISIHLSLCWGTLCNIFGPILGILLNVLRDLKRSLDILHECLDITVVVTKLSDVLASLCFEHFWVLLVYFVLFSSNSREQSQNFIWIFVNLSFWTPIQWKVRWYHQYLSICLSVSSAFFSGMGY